MPPKYDKKSKPKPTCTCYWPKIKSRKLQSLLFNKTNIIPASIFEHCVNLIIRLCILSYLDSN